MMSATFDFSKHIHDLIAISLEAGKAILDIYEKDFAVEYKEDESPLTAADLASNEVIKRGLSAIDSSIPILSEESEQISYENRKNWEIFWLIDPLDGTKEFINNRDEFTANIALVKQGAPIAGFVYAPVLRELFFTASSKAAKKRIYSADFKAFEEADLPQLNEVGSRQRPYTIVASKNHRTPETDSYIEKKKTEYPDLKLESYGSSLKICRVAEGTVDEYPRFAPTMEWDTAAAHAIVRAVGKRMLIAERETILNTDLKYNKENLLNPWFLVT